MSFREQSANSQGNVGIGIDITEKCNRSCPSCYTTHGTREMSFGLFQKVINEGMGLGFSELYILGGEPTLHSEILNFLDFACKKINLVILVTNMDRLSDVNFCREIFETGVTISGQRHTVCSDLEAREMEKILTGGDNLDISNKAWQNVEKIFSPDRVCVQCCITAPVVKSGSIFEVFRWARRKGYDPVMEFTRDGKSFSRGCHLDVDVELLSDVLRKFREIDQNEFSLDGPAFLSPQAYGKTCHMIENCIHFLVDGNAIPCVGHQGVILGNIVNGRLEDILNNPLRQIVSNPAKWIHGFCKEECQNFQHCTAGCRGFAFGASGCSRASFWHCPNMPRDRLTIYDMIPSSCDDCPFEQLDICSPVRQCE